ncbi:hypothetical protein PF66_06394 [Pseudomonas asplenii]|uniref:Prophage PssSM-02 n=1 Tax=Pseudomonas asplenii TaxID=53407 RepID=A0A0M9GBT9_9PSED|nr:hypothetical protein [Pseudomonas fuscovaginae]KPA87049.1 hypothetical protein PF66_06394 [Pseudomonas fuscovaginae]
MLNDVQQDQLLLSLYATAETMGQQLSQPAALMMVEDLCQHTEQALVAALRACRIEGGRLTTALILKHAQAADGRPGKDEAWAIAMTTHDEFETVVLTDEIQLALAAAKPVLDAGDKVGARMAFISAYERFVTQARADAKPVGWHVSVGFDANRRVQAITRAVQMQRIPQEHGQKYLADLNIAPVTEDGRAIAGLLTGTVTRPAANLREKLAKVKASMQEMRQASAEKKLEMQIAAANDLAGRRAMLIKQAQGLEQKHDTQEAH